MRRKRSQSGLGEDSRTICKCVSNRGTKLPEYLPKSFFEVIIDEHMLINSKVGRGKLRKSGYVEIGVLVPI